MNETKKKRTTGTRCPTLIFDKWHGIFYMPSRTDTARHTVSFIKCLTQQCCKNGTRSLMPRNTEHIKAIQRLKSDEYDNEAQTYLIIVPEGCQDQIFCLEGIIDGITHVSPP